MKKARLLLAALALTLAATTTACTTSLTGPDCGDATCQHNPGPNAHNPGPNA